MDNLSSAELAERAAVLAEMLGVTQTQAEDIVATGNGQGCLQSAE